MYIQSLKRGESLDFMDMYIGVQYMQVEVATVQVYRCTYRYTGVRTGIQVYVQVWV